MAERDDNQKRKTHKTQSSGKESEEFYRQIRVIGLAIFLPFVMVAGPVAGYLIGDWIGGLMGGATWPRTAGLVLGLVAGVQQTILIIRRLLAEMK